MFQPQHLINTFDRSHRFVRWSVLIAVSIAFLRSFSLDRPINSAISITFFLLGWLLAHAIFIQEAWIVTRVNKLVDRGLETLPPVEGVAEHTEPTEKHRSVLKQGLIIVILPILAFFLLTSTRSAMGLGLIWGVMSVYAYDMLSFLLEKKPEIVDPYFGTFAESASTLRNASMAYLVFVFLFALLLVAARLAQL
jgi:hypothetical protein